MPQLQIAAHDYTKTETTKLSFTGEGKAPIRNTVSVTETVEARFEVPGLADFRYGHVDTFRRLFLLKLIFKNEDGAGWELDDWHCTASAHNVRKGGELGAMVTVDWFSLPKEVKELAQTEGLAWLRKEEYAS